MTERSKLGMVVEGMDVNVSSLDNQAVVRRYFEQVWEKGNQEAIDELFAPEFVNHAATSALPPGPAGLRKNYSSTSAAFPDVRFSIDDIFSSQDSNRVVVRYTMRGTHHGPFQGIQPTGNQVSVKGIGIYRVENDRIAEGWVLRDSLNLLKQLEVAEG